MNETPVTGMRTVTILLTRYYSWFGSLVCLVSRSDYSHASISIEETPSTFYSFNFKGFTTEHPYRRKRRGNALRISLLVTEEAYQEIEAELSRFAQRRERYTYSRWGVLCCLMRIPHKFEHQYFCSQFIAELLNKAGVIELRWSPSLVMPHHLANGRGFRYAFEPLEISRCIV